MGDGVLRYTTVARMPMGPLADPMTMPKAAPRPPPRPQGYSRCGGRRAVWSTLVDGDLLADARHCRSRLRTRRSWARDARRRGRTLDRGWICSGLLQLAMSEILRVPAVRGIDAWRDTGRCDPPDDVV